MNPATRLMVQALQSLAEEGKTCAEAAKEMGVDYHYVAAYSRRHSIQFKAGYRFGTPDARSEDMKARYQDGQTLEQIGQAYGITRERARQIMTKHYGIRANDGGKSEQVRKKRRQFIKHREARMMKAWGGSYKQYQSILKHPDQPTRAFAFQKHNAIQRGIPWELTLLQWWMLWQQSGHWSERGRGKGYCMCRLNDTGPYAVDNIYIATGTENMQDYWVNKRADASLEVAA